MLSATAQRLARAPGLGSGALEVVQGSRIAVVGAGAIGGNAVQHAAQLGVPLRVIDCDTVAAENLGSSAFPAASVGRPKSEVRAEQARALNPDVPVEAVHARLEDLGLAALADCGVILAGLDGRPARARVSELSCALGVPWIDASVSGEGESEVASVVLYDPRAPDAACYLCPHDEASLAALAQEGRGPGCASWRSAAADTPPTLQGSALPALAASLAFGFAVRVLLDRAEGLRGRRLVLDCAGLPRLLDLELRANRRCLGRHDAWPLGAAPGASVSALWDDAKLQLGAAPEALLLHHRLLVRDLSCSSCGAGYPARGSVATLADADLGCACAGGLEPELFDRITRRDLAELGGLAWSELGLPASDVVTALLGNRELHYRVCDA